MSPHPYVILGALLLAAFALGGSVADFAARARARQQCRALLRWRVRLGQLHEAHMTARDAWTRQGNARYTPRYADVVRSAKLLQQHIEAMPL